MCNAALWLIVFNFTLTHFLAKTIFFQRVCGVNSVVKKWKFQEGGGGGLCEILSVMGVWILSGTTQCQKL